MRYVLTVDPGGYTMGACLFAYPGWQSDMVCPPCQSMVIGYTKKERDKYTPHEALIYMINRLRTLWFENYDIRLCFCERPRLFGSARSMASGIKGHLQMMDMFRGALLQLCDDHGVNFSNVDVLDWKGQLPKHLVNQRIREILNGGSTVLSDNESHDWDACGIGLYLQGVF